MVSGDWDRGRVRVLADTDTAKEADEAVVRLKHPAVDLQSPLDLARHRSQTRTIRYPRLVRSFDRLSRESAPVPGGDGLGAVYRVQPHPAACPRRP